MSDATKKPIADLRAAPSAYFVLGLCFGGIPAVLWIALGIFKPELIWDSLKVLALATGTVGTVFLWLFSHRATLYADRIVFKRWLSSLEIPLRQVRRLRIASGDLASGGPHQRLEVQYQSPEGVRTMRFNIKIFRWADVTQFETKAAELVK